MPGQTPDMLNPSALAEQICDREDWERVWRELLANPVSRSGASFASMWLL